jgi:hypothetical protein
MTARFKFQFEVEGDKIDVRVSITLTVNAESGDAFIIVNGIIFIVKFRFGEAEIKSRKGL